MSKKFIDSDAAPWKGVAAKAVQAGNILYLSGQAGRGESFEAQAEHALDSIARVLEVAGGSMGDVVKLVLYFRDASDWATYRQVAARYWPSDPPAATGVVVVGLLFPEIMLEIDAVAVLEP